MGVSPSATANGFAVSSGWKLGDKDHVNPRFFENVRQLFGSRSSGFGQRCIGGGALLLSVTHDIDGGRRPALSG